MNLASSVLSVSILAALGAGLLGGCGAAPAAEEEVAQDEVNASELDDPVAKTILAGGCDVVSAGQTTKTPGTGGACPTKLTGILDLLEGKKSDASESGDGGAASIIPPFITTGKIQVFAVAEQGDQPGADGHRFVIAATGENAAKLFVATVSSDGEASEDGVEAMGFSAKLNAFAYYKVEKGKWVRKGDGSQVKAAAKDAKPAFECITCHTTGAPLMKELHDSWANWHSTWFSMPDPAKQGATFKRLFDKVERADLLEPLVIQATKLHSKGRVDRAKSEGDLKGVLTQLMCEVGEPSLIGVHSKTSTRLGKPSVSSSMLPSNILLNPLFTPPSTGTGPEKGLEQALGAKIPSLRSVNILPAAYNDAIEKNGQTIGGQPGDAMFALFTPEKSYADLDAVQELLRQNLVDKDLVADVLMTDFTVSAFSDIRCELAETLPDTWKDADDLRAQWSKALASSSARGAKGLAARLADKADFAKHEATLETYLKACVGRKDKPAFTEDVLKVVSQRRVEFVERYHSVVESSWLIPKDKLGSTSNAVRLNASTCEIEPTKAPFAGEE